MHRRSPQILLTLRLLLKTPVLMQAGAYSLLPVLLPPAMVMF
jgi:hypothetical protein